jgi:acyl transferase domain-containing protein/acyl carrier protein
MDSVLLPGTGFIELALTAGERTGARELQELTLEAPLLLDDRGAVQIQLTVSSPDEEGSRSIGIYSRLEGSSEDELLESEQWTCHATGVLSESESALPQEQFQGFADGSWPPPRAEPLDVEFLYDRLSETGYSYGPAFQGLRQAWRLGDEIFAEIALGEAQQDQASGFCIHPALLDSALHTSLLGVLDAQRSGEMKIPFSFSGVRLYGQGASLLRVRLGRSTETLSLLALDEQGDVVFCIDSLIARPVDQSQLQSARRQGHDALYELEWVEVPVQSPNGSRLHAALLGSGEDLEAPGIEIEHYADLEALEDAIEQGTSPPELVLIQARAVVDGQELAGAVHMICEDTLGLLKAWLASERFSESKLVLLTEGALATGRDGALPGLVQAALPGLMRSAQSEHPGRFSLIDSDASETSRSSLHSALVSEEPELALREGSIYAPRLARLKAEDLDRFQPSLDLDGTVLITGGTSGLGALLARHLVSGHGVRHLLLVSRSGLEAGGAEELRENLQELGCDVQVAACDVSDRAQLQGVIARVSEEHPLTAVIHAAGTLDDGVIESLDGERLRGVMAPKVDGAINLHELTEHLGLAEFILFSSAAASMGSPGQGNYAAANAFLDMLACQRRAKGLPGLSLAFGEWERATGMTDALNESDRARIARLGIGSLSDEQGLQLIDTARTVVDRPLLLPVRLNIAVLRSQARAGVLPALMRGLIRAPIRRTSDVGGSLARRLAGMPESDWDGIVAEFVSGHIAAVLGHASAEVIDPERAFKEAGFDSLGAIELRNRLSQGTGLRLPSTLIFDHPTPAAVAKYLLGRLSLGVAGADHDSREVEIQKALSSIPLSRLRRAGLMEALMELVHSDDGEFLGDESADIDRIDTMDATSLVQRTFENQAVESAERST